MIKTNKILRVATVLLSLQFFCTIDVGPTFAYIPEMNFDELVQLADIVFVGTAAETSPKTGKNRKMVETDVVFSPIRMIHQKDTITEKIGNRITLTFAGGQFNEAYTLVSDMPRIEKGQRYLVFAYYDGQSYANPFVGGEQGLLKIMADETTGKDYPLKIDGLGITDIQEGKFHLTPPIKKIHKGMPEQAESRTQIKRAAAPHIPEGWAGKPMNHKAEMPPENILNLEEMIRHIDDATKKEPSEKVLEKLNKRAVSALSRNSTQNDTLKSKKTAWEFSDDGKLVILDPSKVKCQDSDRKTSGDEDVSVQNNVAPLKSGTSWEDIFIYGWADLPNIMEMVPESHWDYFENHRALGQYNIYIDNLIAYRDGDGRFAWLNAYNEFCGFQTEAQEEDIFGKGWGDAIARAWYTGAVCESCQIFETDISFKAEHKWTTDFNCQLYRNISGLWDDACLGSWLYMPVAVHELGHTLGLMCGNENYAYDIPTVMNGGLENSVDDGRGLHVGDTYLLRYWYADQRNNSQMNHEDIGIESWIAQGGTVNATTNKTVYSPGEQVWINNLTVENPGRHAAPTVRVRAYLSNDTDLLGLMNDSNALDLAKIPADRLMIGPPPSNVYYEWASMEHEAFWTGVLTFIIPQNIPSGLYRIHLVVTANNDQSATAPAPGDTSYHEVTAQNNHTFLYDQIEVVCPKSPPPTNFIQQGTDIDGIGLSWNAVTNAKHYKVLRYTEDDFAKATLLIDTLTINTYKDTTAVTGTGYFYWVAVQNQCLAWSNATRLASKATRPLTPPCIESATDGTSTAETQIIAQHVNQGNYYCFYYSGSGNNPATAVQLPGECWTSDTSALHTDGVPGKIYYYWAKAATSATGANATALGGVCTDNMGWRKLSPPTDVTATNNIADGIRITWTASPGASAYMVYRNSQNNANTAVPIMGGWGEQTSIYDANTEEGRQYYYWVKAAAESNGIRPSGFSLFAAGSKAFSPVPKVEMGAYGASKGDYTDKVTIGWNPVLWPQETYYYRVYRSEKDDDGLDDVHTAVQISDWQTATSFNDITAVPGKDYWYWASSALSADGFRESEWWLCPYCLDSGWRKLTSPAGVSATGGKFADRIRITWSPADGATHYQVYRSTIETYVPKFPPTLISPVIAENKFDDMDAALVSNTKYYYWVKSSVNAEGERLSGFARSGNEGWKMSPSPTGVTATDGVYTDKIGITWNKVNGLNHYQVFRNTTDNPDKATAISSWQTAAAYDDVSANAGQVYYYWIKGRIDRDDPNLSPFSVPDTGYRAYVPPAGVTASDGAHFDKVAVTWEPSPGASYYQVYRNTVDNPANRNAVVNPEQAVAISDWQTELAFEDLSATVGTVYYYFVAASASDKGEQASECGSGDSGFRVLAPPVNISASKGQFSILVGVSWEKGATEASHFRVYRSRESDPATAQPISDWTTAAYHDDNSAMPGLMYYYWVTEATDETGANESAFGNGGIGEAGFIRINGDVDGNMKIELLDAILALQVSSGMTPPDINPDADIRGKGQISTEDAVYIFEIITGIRKE